MAETSMRVAAQFDVIAATYDETFTDSAVGRAQRQLVWKEMDRVFRSGQRILEINCGTGIDAVHLATRGIEVVACDSSPRMIGLARRRVGGSPGLPVQLFCLPTERISQLESDRPFDGLLSNFSGLNCIGDLQSAVRDLAAVVRPGGKVVVCLFGRFCLWETLWYLAAGDVRKAFRRFSRRGVPATLGEDSTLMVHYWSVATLRKTFVPHFALERWSGAGIATPPTYASRLTARFPWLFRMAAAFDRRVASWPGFRAVADHAILTFERTARATTNGESPSERL